MRPSPQPRAPESRVKREVREFVKSLAWAFVFFLIIRTLAFQAFRIPSPSMEDTLLIHDFLFISKLTYGPKIPFSDTRLPGYRKPKPGDVIVFVNPMNPREDYIKRCVAVGGQTVEYRDKVLYIDGMRRDEPYAKHVSGSLIPRAAGGARYGSRDNFGPVRVPVGELFMMGDNRDNSQDSRYWGTLPMRNVKGKAEIIYFSWSSKKWMPRFARLFRLIR